MDTQGNIIIISHYRDEIIYFYDYIDRNSLLVFVTIPTNQRDREIMNNFITDASVRYIQLDEIDTFNPTFELSEKNKTIIKNILEYRPNRILTQAKATIESDIVSRRVYEFIDSLHTNKHYVPKFNININKIIPKGVYRYLSLYANNNKEKLDSMLSTYNTVDGVRKV